MNNQINETNEFHNPKTNTITIAYPNDAESIERHTHFMLEEIEESDGYIVCYPYGDKNAPIVATFKNGIIYLTIERDCYDIEMSSIHLVGEIAEIYYDSEDIELVRKHLANK